MPESLEDFRRMALFASDFTLDMLIARYQAERNVLAGWVPRVAPGLQGSLRDTADLRNELCILLDEIRRSRVAMRDQVDDVFSASPGEM